MIRLLYLCFLFLPLLTVAEDFRVKIEIKNLPESNHPVLLRIYNGNMFMVDSMPVKEGNSFSFRVPGNIPAGMLKAVLGPSVYAKYTNGQPTSFDLLFNKEDVEISLDFNNPEKTLQILSSNENKLYFKTLREEFIFLRKLGLLEQVVVQYPEQDEFYHTAIKYYQKYQTDREKFLDSLYAAHPDMLAARIIHTRRFPIVPGGLTPTARDSLSRNHFLDKVVFDDTTLLYTNAYTDKIYQYIQLHIKPNLGPRENEAQVIEALEKLMPKLEANEDIRTHLLQFLIQGFESMKMEEVLAHISTNYLQQCNGSLEVTKRRLEGFRKMALGQKVPDFIAVDTARRPVSLYADIHPYTLVIFWHTRCSFCQQLISALHEKELSGNLKRHDIHVLGISIDDEQKDWLEYSRMHKLPFTNTFIGGGFQSETAEAYNIFATPSLFVLDNNHNILAKPITAEELRDYLEKLDR